MGSHSLLQRIFMTQGLNLDLLHSRQILYHLSHQKTQIQKIPTPAPLRRSLSANVMNLAKIHHSHPASQTSGAGAALVALELRQRMQGSRSLLDPHCPFLPSLPSALQNHDMIKGKKGETCSVKPLLFSRPRKHILSGLVVGNQGTHPSPRPLALTILRFQPLLSLLLGKVLLS